MSIICIHCDSLFSSLLEFCPTCGTRNYSIEIEEPIEDEEIGGES